MSGLEHQTYRNTAIHIARAEIEDDKQLSAFIHDMPEEKKALLIKFASRMIEIGMDTEAGLQTDISKDNDLTHELEIYLQGAAESIRTNKEG